MDGEHRWRAARELSGATYSQIADTLGWASSLSAHEAVMSALARDNERVGSIRDEYRMLHLARLERLLRNVWATAATSVVDPDHRRASPQLRRHRPCPPPP